MEPPEDIEIDFDDAVSLRDALLLAMKDVEGRAPLSVKDEELLSNLKINYTQINYLIETQAKP